MIVTKTLSMVVVLVIHSAALIESQAEELTKERFEQIHASFEASPDEPWRTIPWKIALLDAQQTAAKEKKPIFIWAMDGHPLGCT